MEPAPSVCSVSLSDSNPVQPLSQALSSLPGGCGCASAFASAVQANRRKRLGGWLDVGNEPIRLADQCSMGPALSQSKMKADVK